MTEHEKEKRIREYAAGEITWHALQERGRALIREALRAQK